MIYKREDALDWEDFFATEPCSAGWHRFMDGYLPNESIAEGLATAGESDRVWAAEHTNHTEMFHLLLRDELDRVRANCAQRDLTDEEFALLAADTSYDVLWRLASHAEEGEHLRTLYGKTDVPHVLASIARNEATPLDILETLSVHNDESVRGNIVHNNSATEELLTEMYLREHNMSVQRRLASVINSRFGYIPAQSGNVAVAESVPEPDPPTDAPPDWHTAGLSAPLPVVSTPIDSSPEARQGNFDRILYALHFTEGDVQMINRLLMPVPDNGTLQRLRKAACMLAMDGYNAARIYTFLQIEIARLTPVEGSGE